MAGPWPRGRRRVTLSQGISGSFAAPAGAAQSQPRSLSDDLDHPASL